jgi:hypothetical protein
MFAMVDSYGNPLDANYAARRNWNEPLVEITQNKGTSETHPALSMNDEFADFELFTELLISNGKQGKLKGSYVREALTNGMVLLQEKGFNPFMFGVVGASDFHSGTSALEEDNNAGMYNASRPPRTNSNGGGKSVLSTPATFRSVSGLTAVWAADNNREQIFSALRRREAYSTTGTRIKVRFFGGWQYPDDLLTGHDRVASAYAGGVPMGQTLVGSRGRAPRFAVWASKDANGGNLDRIQVIKGWAEKGEAREKIYSVAVSDDRVVMPDGRTSPVGNTVDTRHATYTNDIGDATLGAVWEDPDFDPSRAAYYYVRVLEIPTPRWTTYEAVRYGSKLPEDVPSSIQERAYTSPIWYLP